MGFLRVTDLPGRQLLEQALAEPEREPGWHWRERVNAGLDGLLDAFAVHVAMTEGPDGCYAHVLDQEPRLARRVRALLREHATLIGAMSLLRHRTELPHTADEELRGWGRQLLREVTRHGQRGADLIYQAYGIDLGGEG